MNGKLKVGIVGAGFSGLAIGYRLAKAGVDTTIFEAGSKPGGLAVGFKKPEWGWSVEEHYHHWFTNDYSVLALAREVGHPVITVRPKTSTLLEGKIRQLDSPLSLLMLENLSLLDRLRTGVILGFLKINPSYKSLEGITAKEFLIRYGGQSAWRLLWSPLFEKKFSQFADYISASWFWARIKKRTRSLSYPEGGFLEFGRAIDLSIRENGGKFFYKTPVEKIYKDKNKIVVKTGRNSFAFDKVIVTLPSPLFLKITEGLSEGYRKSLALLEGVGAVNLLLCLDQRFLVDGTYWLNVNEIDFPFLAVVEHTNFINKKHYDGKHLLYVGNYLPREHSFFGKSADALLKEFFPYLKKINPDLNRSWVKDIYLFKAPFAQPIVPLNYSNRVPKFETPLEGLYLCNIQQVYPWDRGTNYAVENREKWAQMVLKS